MQNVTYIFIHIYVSIDVSLFLDIEHTYLVILVYRCTFLIDAEHNIYLFSVYIFIDVSVSLDADHNRYIFVSILFSINAFFLPSAATLIFC
jgi:hypothetical protein